MANKRIYYATQSVQLMPVLANNDGSFTTGTYVSPKGLQSVGMTTNFNLTQLFELGQQDLYDNVEGVPEVEVTLQKTLDGTLPLYLICMGGTNGGGSGASIGSLANNRVNFKLGVFDDTKTAAADTTNTAVECTGMYLSSIGYTFPLDGFSTEDVTLVGNDKKWASKTMTGAFSEAADQQQTASSAVRRLNVNIANSTIPGDIPQGASAHFQSINVRANLGREAINELGKMAPYCRYVKFPLEITSEFVITATEGDKVTADDMIAQGTCSSFKNLTDRTIVVAVCGTGTAGTNTMTIDLGPKNKLTSVNYTGGDTGGGNATVTYSYQTFNYLKVNVNGTFASV